MLIAIPLIVAILALVAIMMTTRMQAGVFGAFFAAIVVVGGFSYGLDSFNLNAYDQEIWNGEISNKINRKENCPRGWVRYQDSFCSEYTTRTVQDGQTCTTDKDGKQTCTPTYTTEYSYDYDWEGRWYLVAENVKDKWEIERVDSQGVIMPKIYRQTNIGDPAVAEKNYKNWIRAASDSLFHDDGAVEENYKEFIPRYPNHVYDYYKLDRIIPVGVQIANLPEYNRQLSNALKTLGPKRQMNAIILVVDASKMNLDFMHAVRRNWKGFKKNDAVTFVGLRNGNVEWAGSMSWSKEAIYDVELRQKILAQRGKPLDLKRVIEDVSNTGMTRYVRREMAEFEYLKDEIPTSMFVIILNIIMLASVVGAAVFYQRKVNLYA